MANISDGSARWKVVNWKDKIEGMQTNLENMMNLIASSLRREMNDLRNSITGGVEGTITEINENIHFLVPIGVILPFASNGILPSGYTFCNGAEISRTEYSRLFETIGTLYGSGDGSTTFNVPDLRGRFIEGSNEAGVVMEAGLPNITGIYYASWNAPYYNGAVGALYQAGKSGVKELYGANSGSGGNNIGFDAHRSNEIYGKSTTVQPPALTMKYIIRSY